MVRRSTHEFLEDGHGEGGTAGGEEGEVVTVSELREMLEGLETLGYADHAVTAYDVDQETHVGVTGVYYAEDLEEDSRVMLSTKYGGDGEE